MISSTLLWRALGSEMEGKEAKVSSKVKNKNSVENRWRRSLEFENLKSIWWSGLEAQNRNEIFQNSVV
jgi:hypothetical protein